MLLTVPNALVDLQRRDLLRETARVPPPETKKTNGEQRSCNVDQHDNISDAESGGTDEEVDESATDDTHTSNWRLTAVTNCNPMPNRIPLCSS